MGKQKIIISGGGTGGHVFPAIAIADALKEKLKESEFLFVGADNRLEMQKVPEAGYPIRGLPVLGFVRKLSFRNVKVLFRLLKSLRISRRIIREFSPDVVVGVGGYASGPIVHTAARKKIPILLQEQNSYAGVTNRLLARKADRICVAYKDMERYFPARKLVMTGNPVRREIQQLSTVNKKEAACMHFSLAPDRKVILVLGGSLGARTINNCIMSHLDRIINARVQLLWQCGSLYYEKLKEFMTKAGTADIHLLDFISRMDLAYAAADLIVSRAGAITVSELSHIGKPVILVPSPNVAEDHQTKNAMALVKNGAAVHINDERAEEELVTEALQMLGNQELIEKLSTNITRLAERDSAGRIADEIIALINDE